MPKLKLFETFAGIGSQRMALRNIGADFESVGIMEVDRYGLLAYAAIHEDWGGQNSVEPEGLPTDAEMLAYMNQLHIGYNFSTDKSELPTSHEDIVKLYVASKRSRNYGDIRLCDPDQLPDMDFFTYSFPCKDFSQCGSRRGGEKGSGTKSALVWECERIIEAKRPTYLMMENVPGMVDQVNIHILQQWCSILEELGYKNYWKVLNSANYGTPQRRRRVIMFSILNGKDKAPFIFDDGYMCTKILKDILVPGEAPAWTYIEKLDEKAKEPKKAGFPGFNFAPTALITAKRYSNYDQGGRVCSIYGPCPTITARNDVYLTGITKSAVCRKIQDDYGVRCLLPIEAWRAQTYSDEDYYKAEGVGLDVKHLTERAGRGICVTMLEAQFKRLFKEYIKE